MSCSFVHLVVRALFRGSMVPWSVVDCSQVELSCTRAEERKRKRKRFVSVRLSSYDHGFTIAEEKKSFFFCRRNTKHESETMMKAKIEESESRSAKKKSCVTAMTGIDAPSTSPVRIALAPPLASIRDAGSKRKRSHRPRGARARSRMHWQGR